MIPIGGQGAAFLAASTAFIVDIVLSIVVSLVTEPKPADQLKGLVYSETPQGGPHGPEGGVATRGTAAPCPSPRMALVHGHRPERVF